MVLFNTQRNKTHIAHTKGWIYEQLIQVTKLFTAHTVYSIFQLAVHERSPSSEHIHVPFVWLQQMVPKFTQLITRQKSHKHSSSLSWQVLNPQMLDPLYIVNTLWLVLCGLCIRTQLYCRTWRILQYVVTWARKMTSCYKRIIHRSLNNNKELLLSKSVICNERFTNCVQNLQPRHIDL